MNMQRYYFVRSVPLLVGVDAESKNKAFHLAGECVDDFMSDAMESVKRIGHDFNQTPYILEYQGDAIHNVRT